MASQVVSITVPKDLILWANWEAKRTGKNRSQIFVEAIKQFKSKETTMALIETGKRMSKDPEMLELAEMGIEDWANNLPPYEN